jgi:hypothetical protein
MSSVPEAFFACLNNSIRKIIEAMIARVVLRIFFSSK